MLLPGAVTEHDGDALLPPSMDVTAAFQVPPLLPSLDVTAEATHVPPLPQPGMDVTGSCPCSAITTVHDVTTPAEVPPLPQSMDVKASAQVPPPSTHPTPPPSPLAPLHWYAS